MTEVIFGLLLVNMNKYLTREGLEKLKKELEHLKETKRKEIAERLEKCIAFGDLTENAEYQETKEEQAFIEGRILDLENLIQNAVIASETKQRMYAQVGSTILVGTGWKKEKFKIVGAKEANPLEGKVSIESPIGKAFFHKQKGAIVAVHTPEGTVQYKILKIE